MSKFDLYLRHDVLSPRPMVHNTEKLQQARPTAKAATPTSDAYKAVGPHKSAKKEAPSLFERVKNFFKGLYNSIFKRPQTT